MIDTILLYPARLISGGSRPSPTMVHCKTDHQTTIYLTVYPYLIKSSAMNQGSLIFYPMFAQAEFSNNRKEARGTHKIKCKNRGSLGRGSCIRKEERRMKIEENQMKNMSTAAVGRTYRLQEYYIDKLLTNKG